MRRRRGSIYDGFLRDVPDDPRPVLVVSADAVNRGMQPIVAHVTTRECTRALPTDVVLENGEGGITQRSWVLCDELATLDDADLAERPGVR